MSPKARYFISLLVSALFFILDQSLKWRALYSATQPQLLHRFFGWNPFLNPGIAFGIPIPNLLIIILTVPILLGLVYMLFNPGRVPVTFKKAVGTSSAQQLPQKFSTWLSALLIFVGALSNLIDRIFYHYTVDYLLIFTAIINLADVLIVSGFVIYFVQAVKHRGVKTVDNPPRAEN